MEVEDAGLSAQTPNRKKEHIVICVMDNFNVWTKSVLL